MSPPRRREPATASAMRLCRGFAVLPAIWLWLLVPAAAGEGKFVGSWRNIDAETSGITRIEIRQRPERLELNPFGRCHPVDCDWGWLPAQVYYTSPASRESAALLAEFKSGSGTRRLDKVMTLRLEQGLLRVEIFTVFGDERTPYWAVYHFKTKEPQPSRPVPALPPLLR